MLVAREIARSSAEGIDQASMQCHMLLGLERACLGVIGGGVLCAVQR